MGKIFWAILMDISKRGSAWENRWFLVSLVLLVCWGPSDFIVGWGLLMELREQSLCEVGSAYTAAYGMED